MFACYWKWESTKTHDGKRKNLPEQGSWDLRSKDNGGVVMDGSSFMPGWRQRVECRCMCICKFGVEKLGYSDLITSVFSLKDESRSSTLSEVGADWEDKNGKGRVCGKFEKKY